MKNLKFILLFSIILVSLIFIVSCLCVDNPCDDGEFCNGSEICKANGGVVVCEDGTPPCDDGYCDEELDVCQPCITDDHCEDGLFCNGTEFCELFKCFHRGNPCPELCDEELDECITENFLNLTITVTIDFSNMTTTGDCTGISFPSAWSDTFTVETDFGTITITQPSTNQKCIGTIDSEGNYDCEAQQGQVTFGYTGHLNEDGTGTSETFHMENDCTFIWTGQKNPQ